MTVRDTPPAPRGPDSSSEGTPCEKLKGPQRATNPRSCRRGQAESARADRPGHLLRGQQIIIIK